MHHPRYIIPVVRSELLMSIYLSRDCPAQERPVSRGKGQGYIHSSFLLFSFPSLFPFFFFLFPPICLVTNWRSVVPWYKARIPMTVSKEHTCTYGGIYLYTNSTFVFFSFFSSSFLFPLIPCLGPGAMPTAATAMPPGLGIHT